MNIRISRGIEVLAHEEFGHGSTFEDGTSEPRHRLAFSRPIPQEEVNSLGFRLFLAVIPAMSGTCTMIFLSSSREAVSLKQGGTANASCKMTYQEILPILFNCNYPDQAARIAT